MNWLKKALTITTPESGSYYTAVDPMEFYEWRFTGTIPEDTIFTKKLPRSDIFTEGLVIVSAVIPPESLHETGKFGYQLKNDIQVEAVLHAGQVQSPRETTERYIEIKKSFDERVKMFKKSCENRMYFFSSDKPSHLYFITKSEGNKVEMSNFGTTSELSKKLADVRSHLINTSMKRTGIAYEMEDFRRFENAMEFMSNPNIPVDYAKIETVVRIADLQPENTRTLNWDECYLEISPEARKTQSLIKKYESLTWLKHSLQYLSPSNT